MKTVVSLATALLLVTLSAAGTENLVVNPEFDTDLDGWSPYGGTWSPEDWQASPTSGSATRTLATGGASVPIADQCVDLAGAPAFEYTLSAQVYMPSGQTGTGSAHLSVGWFSSPGCITQIGGDDSPQVSTTGDWLETVGRYQPPTGAVSLHLGVYLWTQTSGGFQAYTDHVVLISSGIFTDGFESGDLGAWSGSIP